MQGGSITRVALDLALATQRKTFKPLGRILRDDAGLTAEALLAALKKQTHVPRIFLRFFPVQQDAFMLLDSEFCRQHEALAFEKLGRTLCVALSNPNQRNLIRHIESVVGMEVKIFQAPWEDIQKKLNTP